MWCMNLKSRLRLPLFIALLIVAQAGAAFGMLRKSAGLAEDIHQPSAVSAFELQQISERLRPRLADYQSRYEQRQTSLTIANQRLQFSDAVGRHSTHDPFDVLWHEKNNTPVFIRVEGGKNSLQKQALHLPAKDAAIKFLQENNQLFRLENPAQELVSTLEKVDALGKTHVAFNQYYQGIPVWGHDIVVHLDEYHQVYALNARYSPTPTALVDRPGISASTAIHIASADLEKATRIEELPSWAKSVCDYHEPQAQRYVWIEEKSQRPHLVWHVRIRPNLRDHWYYFVDAKNGAILEKYNATNSDGIATTAIATDLNGVEQTVHSFLLGVSYYLIDASRPIWQENQPDVLNDPRGALLTLDVQNHDLDQNVTLYHVISFENYWGDPAAVSAHCNMGVVFDYFYNTHGRRAIDDNGSTVISLIHVTDDGKSMDNAYWNGALMLYGDGDLAYKALAGGLDVAAHEMAHGVIQHTVGLEYKFQSGVLNESLADVFGVMVDREDWRLGEDIAKTDYYPSGALRDMQEPHNGGRTVNDLSWQPAHMDEYVELNISDDNGGVHTNSGIPNHACYLIGSALGKEKTESIYYRILDARYLNAQSNFVDMRLAAIQSATDLYGAGSPEVNAVTAAFDAVGIAGSGGSQPDPDLPPVVGEEWITTIEWNAADPDGGALYLVRPVIEDENTDIMLLTPTRVSTATGNPVSVSDDGLSIIFVDAEHQLCAINSDGSGEVVLNDQPVWNSVALSPDGRMLAATTTLVDSSIYIIDLSGSDEHKKIRLYSPTTQENQRDYATVLADAMDWNLSSEYLIFDALTSIPQANGASLEYWSINILDPASETIAMLFPPQPEGVSIGNPSFGQTNDIYMVFDYVDMNQGINEIRSANLFTGDMFTIEENANSIGYPRYSPDDRHIAFQRWQSDDADVFPVLRQIGLKESKIEAAGNSNEHVYHAMLPTWFAIGSRPTAVQDEVTARPAEFSLAQNYPNPFNSETMINYHLPRKGQVTLSIYNLLGEEVALLLQEEQDAGAHQVVFDGSALPSGLYLYRLIANNVSATRRMVLLK